MYNLNFDIWKFGHPQCANSANGAMSSLNILKNDIGTEQAQALIKIKQENKLITLCGLKGDETELNLCGKMSGAEDALMLAEDIKGNEAMSILNVSNNRIGAEGAKALVPAM